MIAVTRTLTLMLSIVSGVIVPLQPSQQPSQQAQQQARPPAATIRGRVIDAESGRPLRHAMVDIMSHELREIRIAATDDQGRYEFTALRASRYRLGAGKDGYLPQEYGQTRPVGQGKWIDVRDAETIEQIDVALPRAGVIAGRVVDRYGDPVVNLTVRALRYTIVNGRKRLTDETSDTTDDLGAYRLSGLVPARYYVSAVAPHERPQDRATSDANNDDSDNEDEMDSDLEGAGRASDYAPTYYPGTPNVLEGRSLSVTLGQSIAGIDFTLVPTRTARVSGTVVSSKGAPLRGTVTAEQIDAAFGEDVRADVRTDGTFSLNGLPPGEYRLHAENNDEAADAPLTVAGRDIANVRLIGEPPVRVFGRIILDAAGAAAAPAPSAFHLLLATAPVGARSTRRTRDTTVVHDDWTFVTSALPGRNDFVLAMRTMPAGWSVKAIRLNGIDVTDTGIDCKPNEEIRGLEFEITDHPPRVSGTVVNDRGEPVKDYTLIVFPQDDQRWTPDSRYVLTAQPDRDGRFTVVAPPRADYLAIAVDELQPDASADPEILAQLRDRATAFALTDGDTRVLTLTISPWNKP